MCPVNAIRVAYTGELGWELHHPIEMQNYLFDLLEKAGEKHGMKLVGARAQNWLRQEYVTPDAAVVGGAIQVKMQDKLWPARIVEDSPYDPKNATIRVDG